MVSGMVKTVIVASVGVAVVILSSTLGWILIPDLATSGVVITSENTAVYDAWKIPPVPIYLQFFLFNCTNCNDPTNNTVTLNLDQLGPFTFREGREKFDIIEFDGRLSFYENETYVYDPTDNETSMDVEVVTVNPVYFTLASLIKDYVPPSLLNEVSTAMHLLLKSIDEGPFMKRTVRELLFDGWSLQNYVDLIVILSSIAGIELPQLPEDPRFGLYYGVNNTNSGQFTIESGARGLDQLGLIREWNGETKLSYWNDSYCDMINGTDGAIFPPLVDVNKEAYIFIPDLCRSIYTTYERDVDTLGITGKRFSVPSIVFGNVTENPDNMCYCRHENYDPERCFAAGILDLRSCQNGAPVLLSTPHFYLGDEKYVNAFTGLKPVQEWHETHLDLEPLTGIPIFASERIQINLDVRAYGLHPRFMNLNDTVFPLLWVNETAKLDDVSANDLAKGLNVANALNISRWSFLGAGIVLVLAAFVMLGVYFPR